MIIRKESEEEFNQIYDLVKIAFQTAKVSSGDEQNFVNKLRASGNYIPELALVVEENGKLIGHMMLTRAYIINDDRRHEVLYLAPISVALEHRSKGIGSELIKESFRLARNMGHTAVVLVGDPAYYHRFGFKSAITFGIKPKMEIPDEYVMACELVPGALNGISGVTDCF
jgi:putative acetyltransferase